MTKAISSRAAALLLAAVVVLSAFAFASTADAAMTSFNGTGYKQAVDCTASDDRLIYETIDGKATLVGCTPQASMDAANAEASRIQTTGVKFAAGASVLLKDGSFALCPAWYSPMGCVIAPELVR